MLPFYCCCSLKFKYRILKNKQTRYQNYKQNNNNNNNHIYYIKHIFILKTLIITDLLARVANDISIFHAPVKKKSIIFFFFFFFSFFIYRCRMFNAEKFNSNCPEPQETAQRKKSNCDVIYKIKELNMMSYSKGTNNYRMIRVNTIKFK